MTSLRIFFSASKLFSLRNTTSCYARAALKPTNFSRALHTSLSVSNPQPSSIILDATKTASSSTRAKNLSTVKKTTPRKKPAAKASSKKKTAAKKKPVKKAAKKTVPKKKPALRKLQAPPRTATAYSVFLKENVESIRQDMRDDGIEKFSMAEFAKRLSQQYQNMSDAEREALQERTKIAKKEAEEKFNEWVSSLSVEQVRNQNKVLKSSKKKKIPIAHADKPKRPMTAYFIYMQHVKNNPALLSEIAGDVSKPMELSSIIAKKWKSLSDEEQEPFFKQQKMALEGYRTEYMKYLQRHNNN